jgi:hypothetical protein
MSSGMGPKAMGVECAVSLQRALTREALRYAGSLAVVIFYKGERPLDCNGVAQGERLVKRSVTETIMRGLIAGDDLEMPDGADYWRLYDNNGHCLMQGGECDAATG